MSATSPIGIECSQLVLADVTALTFAFLLLGLLAPSDRPTWGKAISAGACLALATASKHHFALWAIAVVLFWILHVRVLGVRTAAQQLALAGLAGLVVYVALVPWIWLNPVLYAKEFAVTVLGKVTGFQSGVPARGLRNVIDPMLACGWLVMLAPLLAPFAIRQRRRLVAMVPVIAVALVMMELLYVSARVYARYGLVFFPAFVLVGSEALSNALADRAKVMRVLAASGLIVMLLLTARQIVATQTTLGKLPSDTLAHDWINAHVPWGARIAITSVDPQPYKRTQGQLEKIVEDINTPGAYARKMASNGFAVTSNAQPMRDAILNDELKEAYWARRELSVRGSEGYVVTRYSDEPHFDMLTTEEAIEQFQSGKLDVLVLNRADSRLPPPVVAFPGQPGEHLFLHVRPGVGATSGISRVQR
jgi:hypothetical protein